LALVGGIAMAMTNAPETGMKGPETANLFFGQTNNFTSCGLRPR
jgi:hypothetical protein